MIEYWVKVVGMLQQNGAIIFEAASGSVRVDFIDDRSWVFDSMKFASEDEASAGLLRNGFERFAGDERFRRLFDPPPPPFQPGAHPNGPIYPSGRFWI